MFDRVCTDTCAGGANDPSDHLKEPPGIVNWPTSVWCRCRRAVNSLRTPAASSIWERRMREIRTSGVTRGEQASGHGMRVLSHVWGNPDTEVDRSLNTDTCSPTLLIQI